MDDLDHRSLGSRLGLWHLQEDAPGMVFWHPRGYAVYRVLECRSATPSSGPATATSPRARCTG